MLGKGLHESVTALVEGELAVVLDALDDRKALEVTALDLRGLFDVADFFVICTGTSDTHVRGMADHVVERMKAGGHPLHHIEGEREAQWVLLDFVDIVVHLFHPAVRAFYQLELLWSDAPVVSVGKELEA